MANYSASNGLAGTLQAITSTYKSLLSLTAAASGTIRRGKLYDVTFGTLGTPADQTYEFDISATTAVGTATAVTPVPLDAADAAFSGVGAANMTAEPTVTATSSKFYLGINQRASYRWVAAPGSELVYPATASNGLVIRTRSASGGTATATAQFYLAEQ
jgi:hypothetical protein